MVFTVSKFVTYTYTVYDAHDIILSMPPVYFCALLALFSGQLHLTQFSIFTGYLKFLQHADPLESWGKLLFAIIAVGSFFCVILAYVAYFASNWLYRISLNCFYCPFEPRQRNLNTICALDAALSSHYACRIITTYHKWRSGRIMRALSRYVCFTIIYHFWC